MRVASGVLPCTDYPPLGSASEWYCTWCIVVSRTYGGRLKRNQMSNARNRHKIQNLANNLSTKKGANPFDVLIVAIVLGGCVLIVLNKVHQEYAVAEEIARERGLIENFILDATRRYYEVQVTTVRGRVYVGVLVQGPDFLPIDGKIESIAIVPIESGYRDPVLQSVKLEENNWQAIEDRILAIPEEVRQDDVRISTLLNELSVVIPINEIALLKRSWVNVGIEVG